MRPTLTELYDRLRGRFGHQRWWPGETPFEVVVGAVLTQNTSWTHVERAIANLKAAGLLSPDALHRLPEAALAGHLRPAGYYNVKARRLKSVVAWVVEELGGEIERLADRPLSDARAALLAVHGVGEETADSILLYAVGQPVFVVDAYTRRVFSRLGLSDPDASYPVLQSMFMEGLPSDPTMYNDYHAQIVKLGKDHCRPTPRCGGCPLEHACPTSGPPG